MRIGKLRRTALEISGFLFAIGLIAAGCAATAPALTPIRDPTQRLDLPGLSVLPPKGANWFLTSVPPKPDVPAVFLVGFAKKLREEPPTRQADARLIYARVTAADLQDPRMQAPAAFETPAAFLDWLKQSAEKRTGEMVTGRQRLIEHDATLDDSLGATCARYRRVTELTGFGRFQESVFILATRGLFCLHPHWPRYLIDVGYTQLHLKGEEPMLLDVEVEPFLRSPLFISTRPMAQTPAESPPMEANVYFNRGVSYNRKGQYDEAISDFDKAIRINPEYAYAYVERGLAYGKKGQNDRAVTDYKRALESNPRLAQAYYNLANEYYRQHRYGEAEPLYRRALQLYEETLGQEHRYVADSLHWLAHTYQAQGKYAEAEPLFKRALAIMEKTLGPDDQEVGHHMKDYAVLLRKMGREAEAKEMEARSAAIRAKHAK